MKFMDKLKLTIANPFFVVIVATAAFSIALLGVADLLGADIDWSGRRCG